MISCTSFEGSGLARINLLGFFDFFEVEFDALISDGLVAKEKAL